MAEFHATIQGELRIDNPSIPPIQRVNDSYIMDHVLERGEFSAPEICRINYCRLYLQAITVSDVSTATGDKLAPGIRIGQPTLWSGATRLHKTHQDKPNPSTWRLWSIAMNLLADVNDKLYVPLRQWILPHHQQRQLWTVYFDPMTDSIFFPKAGIYEKHAKSKNLFPYDYSGWSKILPQEAYPVSLLEHQHGWSVERYNSYCPTLPTAPLTSFAAYCSFIGRLGITITSYDQVPVRSVKYRLID